jgi:beta-lactamase superfamily II metal-dependent hydrolase
MAQPAPIPSVNLVQDDFVAHVKARPDTLVYFLCNVGDADAQLLLLPEVGTPARRQAVVVDAGRTDEIPNLIDLLASEGILSLQVDNNELIALVVTTHPHLDHVRGIPELFARFGDQIAEYWDPGYYHVLAEYHETMLEVEQRPNLVYAQPTSGFRRWISNVAITVLSPSIQLRNRYDSYGIEINDASISLRIEFPVHRYLEDREEIEQGGAIDPPRARSLVLGADAQTTSWAYVLGDFPFLHKSETPAAKAIAAAQGNVDLLKADVFKVSHHGSKHGVSLELVERIDPKVTLISSVAQLGKFNFPHTVAQELIREAIFPSKGLGNYPDDFDPAMNLFYTADVEADAGNTPLGSIALVMSDQDCSLWRFRDQPQETIDLSRAVRWAADIW